ncbi:MAG TPA: hypothetical protein VNA20_06280 [Frankiaceae bacterium]|nr:hypothetical protein [Frankiaceae bacterium]
MAMFVRRRWPWAVAAVGVVAVVVLAAVLLLRGGDDPAPAPGAGTGDPDIVETAEPVPDPTSPSVALDALLVAPDAELARYADHELTANAVPVQSVVGPDAVWIGDSPEDRVLVVLTNADKPFGNDAGVTRLTFVGTVKPLSPDFAKALGLSGADLREATAQRTFVEISDYQLA